MSEALAIIDALKLSIEKEMESVEYDSYSWGMLNASLESVNDAHQYISNAAKTLHIPSGVNADEFHEMMNGIDFRQN